ncbi:MAG: outer membrane beta-barrel protein [Flavobacteriales bacterium]
MKRTQITKILFLFSMVCIAINGYSQTEDEEEKNRAVKGSKKIQVGIRSGLNYSFSSGNLVESLDSRISYHVGSYLQIPTKRKKMIIETGVFYSNEGYEAGLLYGEKLQNSLNLPAIGNDALTRLHLEYLDIQLILKDNQSEKFSAFGGLEFAYLLGSELTQEYKDSDNNNQVFTSTSSKGINKTNIGAILGLEYHVNKFFHINAQYTYPISRVFQNAESDVKNNIIKLSAGFTF